MPPAIIGKPGGGQFRPITVRWFWIVEVFDRTLCDQTRERKYGGRKMLIKKITWVVFLVRM